MKQLYQDIIISLIDQKTSALDLGCADGELLEKLNQKKEITGYGIDIDFNNVKACVKRGISVYQGDLGACLGDFTDKSYNYVILSQTLQQVYDPEYILNEMLRIGKKGIVTFPNFGHWLIRLKLLLFGFSPKSSALPYEWFNTPNIRVITINDFRKLCKKQKINIIKEIPLFRSKIMQKIFPLAFLNLFSKKGVFLIEKV